MMTRELHEREMMMKNKDEMRDEERSRQIKTHERMR
jgi:ribosomal protein S19